MSMLLSLNNQLEELEGKQGVSSRWMPSDPQYEQIRKQILTDSDSDTDPDSDSSDSEMF